jgi:DNA segregation ATPase FtsK/SpoIIIE-like protein
VNTTNKDYFTFNVHNSALLVGQTGTGKSELVRTYLRRLEQAFTPGQMRYVIYDLKQVEWLPHLANGKTNPSGAKLAYLYKNVMYGAPQNMDYLEDLAKLAEARSKEQKPEPFIFIYIEKCDMAFQYPNRFHDAIIKIIRTAKDANMKLIFSTSRPSFNVIPPHFRNSFDLVLSGTLASETDAVTMGMPGAESLSKYVFMVKENRPA